MAGGARARILVCSAPASDPEEKARVYGKLFEKLGAAEVVIILNGRIGHTSAPEAGRDEVLALTDSVVHVLPDGYGFDLRSMRPLLPDGTEIAPESPSLRQESGAARAG